MRAKFLGPIIAASALAFAGAAGAAICKDAEVKCSPDATYQKETSSKITVSGCEALLQRLRTESISSTVHETLKKVVGQFEFKEACENHAKCYAGIGELEAKSREKCDEEFKEAMNKSCDQKFAKKDVLGVDVNSVPRSACTAGATTFYQAVNQSGCSTYAEQRKKFHCAAKADTDTKKSDENKSKDSSSSEDKNKSETSRE